MMFADISAQTDIEADIPRRLNIVFEVDLA
jgi:hypothetical protein